MFGGDRDLIAFPQLAHPVQRPLEDLLVQTEDGKASGQGLLGQRCTVETVAGQQGGEEIMIGRGRCSRHGKTCRFSS